MTGTELIPIIIVYIPGLLLTISSLIKTHHSSKYKSLTIQKLQKQKELAINKLNYEKKAEQIEDDRIYRLNQAKRDYEKKQARINLEIKSLDEQAEYEKAKSKLEMGLTNSSVENWKKQGEELIKDGVESVNKLKTQTADLAKSVKEKVGEQVNKTTDNLSKLKDGGVTDFLDKFPKK